MKKKKLNDYTNYRDKVIKVVDNKEFFCILDKYIMMAFMFGKVNLNKKGLSSTIRKSGDVIYFRLELDNDKIKFKAKSDAEVIRGKYIKKEDYSWYLLKDTKEEISNGKVLCCESECIKLFDRDSYQIFEKDSNDKKLYFKDNNEKKLVNNTDFNRCETTYNYRVGTDIVQTKEIKHYLFCDKFKDCRDFYIVSNPNYENKKLCTYDFNDFRAITLEEKEEYLKRGSRIR